MWRARSRQAVLSIGVSGASGGWGSEFLPSFNRGTRVCSTSPAPHRCFTDARPASPGTSLWRRRSPRPRFTSGTAMLAHTRRCACRPPATHSPSSWHAASRSGWRRRTTRLAKLPGPRIAAASSPIARPTAPQPRGPPNRIQLPSPRVSRRHERHRRHRQLPRRVHAVYRFRIRSRAGRRPLARRRADRDRHHAGWALLGDGARRGRARAPDQEDALYRGLRFHHRQFQQPRPDNLRLLRRPRHRGGRREHEPGAAPSAGTARSGGHHCRPADTQLRSPG